MHHTLSTFLGVTECFTCEKCSFDSCVACVKKNADYAGIPMPDVGSSSITSTNSSSSSSTSTTKNSTKSSETGGRGAQKKIPKTPFKVTAIADYLPVDTSQISVTKGIFSVFFALFLHVISPQKIHRIFI